MPTRDDRQFVPPAPIANAIVRARDRRGNLVRSILAWVGVWAFWLVATRGAHPTSALAAIVTTCLVVAYAAAACVNQLVLIPRYCRPGRYGGYAARLGATMLALTGGALAVIRASYAGLWGPDADPNGVYKHFGIDLFGMAVHVIAAAVVVRSVGGHGPKAPRAGAGLHSPGDGR